MAPTLSNDITKPGDLIQIDRGFYKHWAIYIGGDEVVHLIPLTDDLGPAANLLMLMNSSKAKVRRQNIWHVIRSDRYQINNLLDDKYQPHDRDIIVKEACRMVGRELPYCVATHNCEHFVTELRYGKPESRQVKTAAIIAGTAVAAMGVVAIGAVLLAMLKGKGDDDDDDD